MILGYFNYVNLLCIGKLENYSRKYQKHKHEISPNDLKSLMNEFTNKLPTLTSTTNT